MGSVDDWFCNCDQAVTYRKALEEVLDIVDNGVLKDFNKINSIEDVLLRTLKVDPFPDCEECSGTGRVYTKQQVTVECNCVYRKGPWE